MSVIGHLWIKVLSLCRGELGWRIIKKKIKKKKRHGVHWTRTFKSLCSQWKSHVPTLNPFWSPAHEHIRRARQASPLIPEVCQPWPFCMRRRYEHPCNDLISLWEAVIRLRLDFLQGAIHWVPCVGTGPPFEPCTSSMERAELTSLGDAQFLT